MSASAAETLRIEQRRGADIRALIEPLADLRCAVFRQWPYLYAGDRDYERRYLGRYADNPDALLVTVFDGQQLVGASTAQPAETEIAEIRTAIDQAGHALTQVLYFGESILQPGYRGRGLGHRFFDAREAHAAALGRPVTGFCAVERPADHPLRPARPRDLHGFWAARGYLHRPDVACTLDWQDIDQPGEPGHRLSFWFRQT